MRWGPDAEERSSVAKKAHDAYATASAARESVADAIARVSDLEVELAKARADLAQMHKTIGTLSLRLTELEGARVARPTRKAA